MESKIINITPLNPYVSKCDIKVMYHGRNRNGSYISKNVAEKMANSLPGTPIVGVYMNDKNDFNDHGERLVIKDGSFTTERITEAFGYVSEDTKVWWETFEENGKQRDYMMCEGKLWTQRYPQAQRVIEEGNWQSMELEPTSMKGEWMNMDFEKEDEKTFVVEDAAFLGLCILGRDVPPCFETASIGGQGALFSFVNDNSIRGQMSSFNLGEEIALNEGGNKEMPIEEVIVTADVAVENTEVAVEETVEVVEEVVDAPVVDEVEVVEDTEEVEVTEEPVVEEEVVEEVIETEEVEEVVEEEIVIEEPMISESEEQLATTKARLVEVEALLAQALANVEANQEELFALREMKAGIDRKEKESMFAKFYMLNEEDVAPIREAMDSYTVEQIEEKLSVVAFRNKVNFNLDTEENKDDVIVSYGASTVDTVPAWLKAVENVKNKRK